MSRYSKIQKKLIDLREEMNGRLEAIKKDVRRVGGLDKDFAEQATQRENDEVIDALGEAARQELALISNALARIESGEYGQCSSCGEAIGLERLHALPYVAHCVACAEARDKRTFS